VTAENCCPSWMEKLVSALGLLTAAACLLLGLPSGSSAGPLKGRVVVTAFGADNTGVADARPGIQAAINSCSTSVGCDIYFPAGTYKLFTPPPSMSSVLTVPAGVPITIEGAGSGSAQIEPAIYTSAPNYDILAVSAGAAGFSMHDLGVSFVAQAAGGSAIHIPTASTVSLFNLRFSGAYDDIELGQSSSSGISVAYTNIRGITSLGSGHCFLRLDGGVSDTYVRGSYAEANGAANSQILCLPTSIGSSTPFGVSGLFVSDSTFNGFARGFSFAANNTSFSDVVLDDLYVETTVAGPAFELFLPPNSTSIVTNVRVSNSTLESAATACVIHGAATAVRLSGVNCTSGVPSTRPASCPAGSYPRGFALVEINGTGSSSQTFTVNVSAPGTSGSASFTATGSTTASSIASGLGAQINTSSLVSTSTCPLLILVQTFNDAGPITDNSIGNDIELFSYAWSTSLAPTISVSASGAGSYTITVPNATSTFAPVDGMYVGSTSASGPTGVTVADSSAINATYGAGAHLQGGSGLLFLGNSFGDAIMQNMNAIQIDVPSVTYSETQFHDNNLANSSGPAVVFNPALGTAIGQNIRFSGNFAYNPIGLQASTATCGMPVTNPYPFTIQAYISGVFASIAKSGSSTLYPGSSSPQNVAVLLGIGESLTINCSGMTLPSVQWFGN
jgi:Pectate lyase superfamily protein